MQSEPTALKFCDNKPTAKKILLPSGGYLPFSNMQQHNLRYLSQDIDPNSK